MPRSADTSIEMSRQETPEPARERLTEGRTTPPPGGPRVLLAIGPESSGTRVLTRTLSQHPDVTGTLDAEHHADLLDEVWSLLEHGRADDAATALRCHDEAVLLTRRSMPHAAEAGQGARFANFVDIEAFAAVVAAAGRSLVILITVRDPVANLASWTRSRHSSGQSLESAYTQYRDCLAHAIAAAQRLDAPYLVVPLESMLIADAGYWRALFHLLDLEPNATIHYEPRANVNTKHHAWMVEQEFSIAGAVAGARCRAAAFADLVRADGSAVAIAPYPLALADPLAHASSLTIIDGHASPAWLEREAITAARHGTAFHTIGRSAPTPVDAPPDAYTLLAPAIEIHRYCEEREALRQALEGLAIAVAHADTAIVEYLADEPAMLTREFLEHVLAPPTAGRPGEEHCAGEDITSRIPAPAPFGGRSGLRPRGERAVLRYRRTDVDHERVSIAADAFATLIRRALHPDEPLSPPEYHLGRTIDFTLSGTARAFQEAGWSVPERNQTWTLGEESTLLLRQAGEAPPDAGESIDLVIDCIAAVFPGHHDAQSLEVLVNGDVVFADEFRMRRTDPIEIDVPAATWTRRDPVEVRFRHPDAISPKQAGAGKGERPIAFGFRSVAARKKNG